jgi:3-isopropylmalate dehydrogenase
MESMSLFMVCIGASFIRNSTLTYVGSAPDISGKGIVNPVAMILSVSMMLKYSLCLPEVATAIDKAVETVIESGVKTGDIGGTATTKEVGDAVAKELVQILGS